MKSLATLAAASFLAIGGAAAVAQTTPPAQPPGAAEQPTGHGPGLTRSEMDSLTNARVAAIRAGLNLNADQQRLFAPLEQALRAMATERADRMEERRETGRGDQSTGRLDLSQRLEQQAERATRTAQNLTALSNAMKPFYASLDDSQKRLLPMLMRPGGRMAMGRHGHRHGMGEHGMMDHGPRR